jgi:hypothetical protein
LSFAELKKWIYSVHFNASAGQILIGYNRAAKLDQNYMEILNFFLIDVEKFIVSAARLLASLYGLSAKQ